MPRESKGNKLISMLLSIYTYGSPKKIFLVAVKTNGTRINYNESIQMTIYYYIFAFFLAFFCGCR